MTVRSQKLFELFVRFRTSRKTWEHTRCFLLHAPHVARAKKSRTARKNRNRTEAVMRKKRVVFHQL